MTLSESDDTLNLMDDGLRYRELLHRVKTFEHPNGTYVHWLLLSAPSTSPDPGEAIDELIAKRRGKK